MTKEQSTGSVSRRETRSQRGSDVGTLLPDGTREAAGSQGNGRQDPAGRGLVSQKVFAPIRDYFHKPRAAIEEGMPVGTVLSYVLGALGTLWLGSKSVLLAIGGGIASVLAMPQIKSVMNRIVTPFSHRSSYASKADARPASGIVKNAAAPGTSSEIPEHGMTDVDETRLGNLHPLYALVPGTKEQGRLVDPDRT